MGWDGFIGFSENIIFIFSYFLLRNNNMQIFFAAFILCSKDKSIISPVQVHTFSIYTVDKSPEAEFYVTQTMNILDSIEYIYCVPNRVHKMCT